MINVGRSVRIARLARCSTARLPLTSRFHGALMRRYVSTQTTTPSSDGHGVDVSSQVGVGSESRRRKPLPPKSEGTISSVFATLSGGSLTEPLEPRFLDVKRSIVKSQDHALALQAAWREVLQSLSTETQEVIERGASLIPQVTYPGDTVAGRTTAHEWMGREAYDAVKKRGTVIVKNVVPSETVLQWKQDIREYIAANPQTKGFPADDPQVFELYWSKAQLAARGHPSLLRASQALLSLFHAPSQTTSQNVNAAHPSSSGPVPAASLRNVVSYCDRLRIRRRGDATFALGPHIDGGGVERWEDEVFRNVWQAILQPLEQNGKIDWRLHDSWSLGQQGERLAAKTDMYNGPGACSVFRPWQGWLSMSSTGANEGTLRVLPILQSASAYIILRPFFRPKETQEQLAGNRDAYLNADNWTFSVDDSMFDGCSIGRNIELNDDTHPHLRLRQTMTSIPRVEPGDCAFWHCDVVHAVESTHAGQRGQDSSVLYIPAIPLTRTNFDYALHQRDAFVAGTPPPDFPGGMGEANHNGRGTSADILDPTARQAMALEPFNITNDMSKAERSLIEQCNAEL